MARIPTRDKDLPPEVTIIFKEIEDTFGTVPNLFRTYAHYPPLLHTNWEKVKAMLMQGRLSRKLKEVIAILVSLDNDSAYCLATHTGDMLALGVTQEEIDSLQDNLDQTDFSLKEKALIHLAREANRAPHGISDDAFLALRDAGASNAEIVEALGVMELFAAFNKFLVALDVDIEFN
jgi:uncharacterized peroxidase-related enzyme